MLTTPSVLGVYGHFPIARPPPSSVPDSVDANHVLPAEVRNGTQHDCLTARPHTEFSGYVLGDTGAGLAAHETQGLPSLAIRKNVDERGLSSCTTRACFMAPSKTTSPVVLSKSARTTVSFSVRSASLDAGTASASASRGHRRSGRRGRSPQPEPESSTEYPSMVPPPMSAPKKLPSFAFRSMHLSLRTVFLLPAGRSRQRPPEFLSGSILFPASGV